MATNPGGINIMATDRMKANACTVKMTVRGLSGGLLAVLGVALGTAVQAQTKPAAPAQPSLVTLDPVVISATRSERPLEGLPVSATVIGREEIALSPGRTVEETLRSVAGVQLPGDNSATIFPLNPSIAMRGLGVGDTATRTLVLVDGLPINGGFFGNVFWNRAPKNTIDRVEIVRGASSSLFGSLAMGGVVNMVTRKPADMGTTAEIQYGEDNTRQGSFAFGRALGPAAAMGLSADYHRTDGYFQKPANLRQPVNEKLRGDLFNVQGRGDFRFSDAANGFIKFGHNSQERSGGFRLSTSDTKVSDIAGGVDVDLGNRATVMARVFHATENFDVDNVNVPNSSTTFVSNRHRTDSDDLGLSLQWSQGFRGVLSRLGGGVDLRAIDGQNDQDVFNTSGVLSSRILGEGKQFSTGLFGEATLTPSADTEILASLRVDRFRDYDGRLVTNGVAQTFASQAFTKLSPRLAGRYQVTDPVAVRAAYYQGFRAPTLAERYRSFETPTFRSRANASLKEERLTGGDVGLDFRLGKASGQINYFHNVLKDFIASEEVGFTAGKFTVRAANVAELRSRGVELIGDASLMRDLNLSFSYTYTDAEVTAGPLTGNKSEGTPRHMASAGLVYRHGPDTRMNLRGRWLDDSFQDISNESLQDAHFVLDFMLISRMQKNIELFVSATNLFNEQYIAGGFSQTLGQPRRISIGTRFTL